VGRQRAAPPGRRLGRLLGGTNLVTEQTPAGAVVLSLHFSGDHKSYRAQPLPRGRVSAAELRHGMDLMANG
jgi:hypothetical protein